MRINNQVISAASKSVTKQIFTALDRRSFGLRKAGNLITGFIHLYQKQIKIFFTAGVYMETNLDAKTGAGINLINLFCPSIDLILAIRVLVDQVKGEFQVFFGFVFSTVDGGACALANVFFTSHFEPKASNCFGQFRIHHDVVGALFQGLYQEFFLVI